MAFVACDENKAEWIYDEHPQRRKLEFYPSEVGNNCVELPSGTIKKLIGYDLSWYDEPVELI